MVHPIWSKGFRKHQKAILQQHPVLSAVCVLGKCDFGFAALLFTSAAHKALPLPEPLHILKLVLPIYSKNFKRHHKAIMKKLSDYGAVCVLGKCDWCFAALLFTPAAHEAIPLPKPILILTRVHPLCSKGFRRHDQAILKRHPLFCAVCVFGKCDWGYVAFLFTLGAHKALFPSRTTAHSKTGAPYLFKELQKTS